MPREPIQPNDSAFPLAEGDNNYYSWGMNMREWYAGLALQGLLAQAGFADDSTPADAAIMAKRYALLAELAKP